MLEEMEELQAKEDARRAAEWAKREERIKRQMERMGDVVKKSNAAEKEFEARIMRDQLQKDKDDEAKERRKKEAAREREQALLRTLDRQMQEKREMRKREEATNAKYIKMVIDQDEKDRQDQRNA